MNKNVDFNDFSELIGLDSCPYTLILIHHALPTHINFLRFISQKFARTFFLPIPYSSTREDCNKLSNDIEVIIYSNDVSELIENIRKCINSLVNEREKFAIVEVGGYSVEALKCQKDNIHKYIVGIVEDTENGHREHINANLNGELKWQVYSVARSPLKIGEDGLTGDAIVFSLESQLRKNHWIFANKNILIIGFGKIGKGTACALQNKKCNIYVFDNDPIKLVEASSLGFVTGIKQNLLELADIIIGTTGNFSLMESDFRHLKNNVILSSGSSKQREFDLPKLYNNFPVRHQLKGEVEKLSGSNKCVHLVYEGQPVNFIDKGIIGTYIEIVWLEIIMCLKAIVINQNCEFGLYELSSEERKYIANYWLRYHANYI